MINNSQLEKIGMRNRISIRKNISEEPNLLLFARGLSI